MRFFNLTSSALTLAFIASLNVHGQIPVPAVKNFSLSNPAATGVTFQIGYSAGVHEGKVASMKSIVTLSDKNKILSGEFVIPISQITTGNATRDCHMREAMGIEYSKSNFPANHVCDANNQLPASGVDAVSYPDVRFKFVTVKKNSGSDLPEFLEVGKVYSLAVQGQWIIHGKIVDFSSDTSTEFLPVQIKLLDAATQEIQVIAKFQISLKAFNIQVKPFKVLFVSVGVSDNAKISLNTKMILKK